MEPGLICSRCWDFLLPLLHRLTYSGDFNMVLCLINALICIDCGSPYPGTLSDSGWSQQAVSCDVEVFCHIHHDSNCGSSSYKLLHVTLLSLVTLDGAKKHFFGCVCKFGCALFAFLGVFKDNYTWKWEVSFF